METQPITLKKTNISIRYVGFLLFVGYPLACGRGEQPFIVHLGIQLLVFSHL